MKVFLIERNNDIITKYYSLLINNVVEKNRIIKIKNQDAKYNSLIGKLLLQYCCHKYYNIYHLTLQRTQYDKPYIDNFNLHFNLSHSKNRIVLVFSNHPVGIDIENISSFNYGIIRKFFSLKEQKYINSLSNNEKKINEYFKLWTQKESFVKCLGTGFFHHILNTNMVSDDKPLNKKNYKGTNYYFYTKWLQNKSIVTLCNKFEVKEFSITEVSLEDLVNSFI